MNFEPLLLKQEEGTLVITINRPEALNALNPAVFKSLDAVLNWISGTGQDAATSPSGMASPKSIRAIVLTGAGEKAFVAGADIKQFETMGPSGGVEFALNGQALFARLEHMRVPVIAAVNGFALGGGLELALACDFIYASENAKFALPEATLGIMPGFGGTVRLPRRIGVAKAREMAFTGAMIDAAEAWNLGLVNKVVAPGELMKSALAAAKACAKTAPLAVGHIKDSIRRGMNLTEEKANELEARLFGELFASEDKSEGVKAFIEKRKPSFQGK